MIWLCPAVAISATPSIEELYQIIQQQQKEIDALKARNQVVEERLEYTAEAVEKSGSQSVASSTHIGGYGEVHYNNSDNNEDDIEDQIDFHRFVLFAEHRFNDEFRFFSELELEHSIAGDGKEGEIELEQAFIEWNYHDNHLARAGLFLIPTGIINETHEPETFYGTERNGVEKNIIPATWWESGVLASGEIAPGWNYTVAAHSGLFIDTGDGDFKIRDGRQKSAKALANDAAYTGRIEYTGTPGLKAGFSTQYQTDVQQGQGSESPAIFWEGHVAYQSEHFGVRALYADWDIDGEEFEARGADEQRGWYIEPSYRFNEKVGLFTRYSQWNNFDNDNTVDEVKLVEYGINYWIHPQVVLKADWSDFRNGSDGDTLNLGLGFSF
jgi:hypothetical protein